MWTPSECPTTLIPPKHHTQVGRPKKKRKKAYGEKELEQEFDRGGKMTRKGSSIKCGKCGNMGHNVRSCKRQGAEQSIASQESHTATQGAPVYNLDEGDGWFVSLDYVCLFVKFVQDNVWFVPLCLVCSRQC
ncbi:putative transcription factor interactor and regulator CCHC(Zn) family [Helianthus annuus]|nr:putative transcription factor interactor and regulator CCHC(Zn) family [Helianthus annuus]